MISKNKKLIIYNNNKIIFNDTRLSLVLRRYKIIITNKNPDM